ncbi:MAG: carboxypeptidase-like regulatory domain-containing protein [Janthinobacterium lividum]
MALAAIPAPAQTSAATQLTLSGTVLETTSEPIPFASVFVAGTTIGVTADVNGHYELAIPDTVSSKGAVIIKFSTVGFAQTEFTLPPQSHGLLQHDAILAQGSQVISFSVQKPTFTQRLKWKLKHLFSRKD